MEKEGKKGEGKEKNGRGKFSDIVFILEYCTALEEKKHVSVESWRGA